MTAMFVPAPYAARMRGCPHTPPCPAADAVDHDAARVVRHDDNIDASLLCNGVWLFADGGELIPDDSRCGCHPTNPCRGPAPHNQNGAQ